MLQQGLCHLPQLVLGLQLGTRRVPSHVGTLCMGNGPGGAHAQAAAEASDVDIPQLYILGGCAAHVAHIIPSNRAYKGRHGKSAVQHRSAHIRAPQNRTELENNKKKHTSFTGWGVKKGFLNGVVCPRVGSLLSCQLGVDPTCRALY